METLTEQVVLIVTSILVVFVSFLVKEAQEYIRNKRDAIYDSNRSAKINSIISMIDNAIEEGVTNAFRDSAFNTDKTQDEWINEVVEQVTDIIGGSVISFIEKTITDDWEVWLYQKVKFFYSQARRPIK